MQRSGSPRTDIDFVPLEPESSDDFLLTTYVIPAQAGIHVQSELRAPITG